MAKFYSEKNIVKLLYKFADLHSDIHSKKSYDLDSSIGKNISHNHLSNAKEIVADLSSAVNHLPKDERTLVFYKYILHFKWYEVTEQCKISKSGLFEKLKTARDSIIRFLSGRK